MQKKTSKLKIMSTIIISINLMLLIIFLLFSLFEVYPSNDLYAITFILFSISILIIFRLENIKLTSLMFIFNVTLFVFIGGRFFTYYFTLHSGSLFNLMYMVQYEPSLKDELNIFNFILIFLFTSNLSYILYRDNSKKIPIYKKPSPFNNILKYLVFILLLIIFLINIHQEINTLYAVKEGGYLMRYSAQNKEVESGGSFFTTILYVIIGIVISFRLKIMSQITFTLLIMYSIIILLSGQRELFVTTLLLLIWYWGLKKEVSLYQVIIFFVAISLLLLLMMNLSYRTLDSTDTSYFTKLISLLYSQGISLGVLSYGINEISEFPSLAYSTSFAPGVFRVFTIFYPETISYPQDVGFGAYTAYTANPTLYKQGYGLGWSIIGNFILFSYHIKVIFVLLCILWGYIIKILDIKSYSSSFYLGLCTALATKIFFVARAEIKTIIHTAVLYSMLYIVLLLINFITNKLTYKRIER